MDVDFAKILMEVIELDASDLHMTVGAPPMVRVRGQLRALDYPEMTAKDVAEWDSFNHIKLVVALESAFNITFTTKEVVEMANVGDLIKILQEKGINVSW